jgi:hypothetical protein
MTLQQLCNLVFGGDINTPGDITVEELTSEFLPEQIADVQEFLDDHDALIRSIGGIPFEGDSHAYDNIDHPGKEILQDMIDGWD